MSDIVGKKQFANLIGVSPSRVTQFIAEKKLYGDALVGEGFHARIRVSVACEQLKRGLDPRWSGRVRLDVPDMASESSAMAPPDRVEELIKQERLAALQLANERARESAALRAGTFILTADSKREMGRLGAKLLAMFDAAMAEFSTGIAAKSNLSARDAQHLLRTMFRKIRERASQVEAQAASALPLLIEEAEPAGDAVVDDAGGGDQAATDGHADEIAAQAAGRI